MGPHDRIHYWTIRASLRSHHNKLSHFDHNKERSLLLCHCNLKRLTHHLNPSTRRQYASNSASNSVKILLQSCQASTTAHSSIPGTRTCTPHTRITPVAQDARHGPRATTTAMSRSRFELCSSRRRLR